MKALSITVCVLLASSGVIAEEDVKELSGISIIGNKEAPKSLYIVPWKNSQVGVETTLKSGLLDDSNKLIDKEVFMRELEFYELSQNQE
ncbi:MAG: hypothetical protein JSW45_12920 [Thiotrichales bacterium]|nr:MAG: hypothetical protein JSW45_12920 [Thiotrichales bacterium]